jgi:hypothetical protein
MTAADQLSPSLDFAFVSEVFYRSAPPPIFDCAVPPVPRDQPFPCPTIDPGEFNVRAGIRGCPGVPSEAVGTINITRTDLATCRFLIDLDLDLPIPIPRLPGHQRRQCRSARNDSRAN